MKVKQPLKIRSVFSTVTYSGAGVHAQKKGFGSYKRKDRYNNRLGD